MFKRNSHHFGIYHNRPTDWVCSGCDKVIFGSKEICVKCNIDRYGNKRGASTHPSGDWNCPRCSFRVFSERKYCNKCKIDRYGNIEKNDKI